MNALRLWTILVLAGGGCGSVARPDFENGSGGDAGDSADDPGIDAGGRDQPDRPDRPDAGVIPPDDEELPPDAGAAASAVVLSQSTDATTIEVGNTLVCMTCPATVTTYVGCLQDPASATTTNRYFRVFPVSEGFTATRLNIGIEFSNRPQLLFLRLYSLSGALTLNNLTPVSPYFNYTLPEIAPPGIGSATASPAGVYTLLVPNIPVPTGNLVVEVAVPDGRAIGTLLVVGSNGAGQSAPSYLVAPDGACGVFDITDAAAIRPNPSMSLMMTVEGFTE